MATVTLTYTIAVGGQKSATEVMTNFNDILTCINGNIEAANLKANAVVTSKVTDLAITAPKVGAGAITPSKLDLDTAPTSPADGNLWIE